MLNNRDNRKFRKSSGPREEREFEQKILDLARVTRVTKGGKHMRFRACVILGDKKGKVGYGVAKGADVSIAVNKAVAKAKKIIIKIPFIDETISHEIWEKFGAARVMIKPAPKGTGIKAGGPMRVIFELAGVQNIIGKILGSNNKINNTKATINALKKLSDWKK